MTNEDQPKCFQCDINDAVETIHLKNKEGLVTDYTLLCKDCFELVTKTLLTSEQWLRSEDV